MIDLQERLKCVESFESWMELLMEAAPAVMEWQTKL